MTVPDPNHSPLERGVCAEGAALPGDAAAPVPAGMGTASPLAALLAGHLIPDSEIVQLLLKPSLWYIPLTSLSFLAAAAIIGIAGTVFDSFLPGPATSYANFAILLAAARLMWSTLHWMGRYYILTDLRILTISGVFQTQVVECPLRKVARVRMLRTFRDQILRVGNIEIIPQDEHMPVGLWQTVSRARELTDRLQQAVARAKGNGRNT